MVGLLHYSIKGLSFLVLYIGDCDDDPSDDIADMNLKSARCIMLATFKVLSLQHLTVRNHLLPLGKVLKVKCRSQGKYEMIAPLAKALIDAHHVEIESEGPINYKNILRKQVKVVTPIDELLL